MAMYDNENFEELKAQHSREAIRRKLMEGPRHSYLRDFIYGAVDGLVTTFAIVSGVAGAGFSQGVIIVLGLANIVADGFSMAVSNFLGSKADLELREKAREIELNHIERIPEGEREEIRQIYAAKGFNGEELEQVVKTITSNKEVWVETMLQEEFGLPKNTPSPWKAGLVTFGAFFIAGSVPLVPFVWEWLLGSFFSGLFLWSALLTGCAFFVVGCLKGRYVGKRFWYSGFETLVVGGGAASLAFVVGWLLKGVVS